MHKIVPKSYYIFISSLNIIFSSNEIYFCTSDDTKKIVLARGQGLLIVGRMCVDDMVRFY